MKGTKPILNQVYRAHIALARFDEKTADRILSSTNTAKGDVDQDGDLDLIDYAMVMAHISGVDSDEIHPADLLDKKLNNLA